MLRLSTMGYEREVRLELKKLPKNLGNPQVIEQFFVLKDDTTYIRLRKTTFKGQEGYYLTLKFGEQPNQLESTTETNRQIWEYYREHHESRSSYQRKNRYNYGHWTIDEVEEGHNKGKILAELEMVGEASDEVVIPPHFEVKKRN